MGPSEFIAVAGEQPRSRVHECREKPMRCKLCLEYNHTAKRCESSEIVCGKCAQIDHNIKGFRNTERKCYHCESDHNVYQQYPEQRKQEEILAIETKMRVSRERAKNIYQKQKPVRDISYAQVVRKERSEQRTDQP